MFVIKEGTATDKVGEGTTPEVIQSINSFLEKQGYIVRTADQEKDFVSRMSNQDVNKAIGESHQKFEATILETTGIQKTQGEKFHEYHKRAMTEKLKAVTDLENKVKDFETKGLQGSELAKQYKTELESARQQIATLTTEFESKLQAKDTEVFTTRINNDIEKELAVLKTEIDPTIKPELVGDILAARLMKFNGEVKPTSLEGMVIWKDKNGATITDTKTGKPKNLNEIIRPYFADILAKERKQGGAGSGDGKQGGQGGQGGSGGSASWKDATRPAEVTNKVQLTTWLMKDLKLDASTKEYSEAFEKFGEGLPMR